jgi:hypothetical protein
VFDIIPLKDKISNHMAPETSEPSPVLKFMIEGINLQRKLSTLQKIDDLISLQREYFIWRDTLVEFINSNDITPEYQALFFETDEVLNDMGTGGCGVSLEDKRAKLVIKNIKTETSKKINYLESLKIKKPENYIAEYNPLEKTLSVAGKRIVIAERSQSYPADLLQLLFSNKQKIWSQDEALEAWFPNDIKAQKRAQDAKTFYQAGRNINEKISMEVGIKDLVEITTKEASINPKYR